MHSNDALHILVRLLHEDSSNIESGKALDTQQEQTYECYGVLNEKTILYRALRDLEIIKIRELRRIFGCSFRCNAGRIVSYVTGITTETTAKKTSKACDLIFSKSLITLAPLKKMLKSLNKK